MDQKTCYRHSLRIHTVFKEKGHPEKQKQNFPNRKAQREAQSSRSCWARVGMVPMWLQHMSQLATPGPWPSKASGKTPPLGQPRASDTCWYWFQGPRLFQDVGHWLLQDRLVLLLSRRLCVGACVVPTQKPLHVVFIFRIPTFLLQWENIATRSSF
jgi:hypothetical protein